MLKTMKSSLFRCCLAVLALAGLNMLAAFPGSAQNRSESGGGTVSGIVTDEQGPVIGAAVMIKDSQGGVTTGMNGEFTLSGLDLNDVIVVSILGYETQEIPYTGQERLDVRLKTSTEFLDEVVVTALGIKRQEKALSYNVQEVDSEELLRAQDVNFVNSLNGKIAGVTINRSSSGVGGATRVVMRGAKSLEGDNNVLYVIDGIPLVNTTLGQGNDVMGDSRATT